MENDDGFYTIARQVHNERIQAEKSLHNSMKYRAGIAMTYFHVWCFVNERDYKCEDVFKEYLKVENPELNFWIKKYIAENFWGYKYKYDNHKNKWIVTKAPKHIDNGEKIK